MNQSKHNSIEEFIERVEVVSEKVKSVLSFPSFSSAAAAEPKDENSRNSHWFHSATGASQQVEWYCSTCRVEVRDRDSSSECPECHQTMMSGERRAQLGDKVRALALEKEERKTRRLRFQHYRAQKTTCLSNVYDSWEVFEPSSEDEAPPVDRGALKALEDDILQESGNRRKRNKRPKRTRRRATSVSSKVDWIRRWSITRLPLISAGTTRPSTATERSCC